MFFCIQSECGKIRIGKTPNTDTFCAVYFSEFVHIYQKSMQLEILFLQRAQ